MPIATRLELLFDAAVTIASGVFESPTQDLVRKFRQSYANGTTTGKANRLYAASVALTDGGTTDLDLAGGSLTDMLGAAITFVNIRAIILSARATNSTNVTVGNDAAAFVGPFGAAAHTVVLKPGMTACFFDDVGWAVTATTADIIQLVNAAGAAATVDVLLLGTDA